jgi:hypothetical protein
VSFKSERAHEHKASRPETDSHETKQNERAANSKRDTAWCWIGETRKVAGPARAVLSHTYPRMIEEAQLSSLMRVYHTMKERGAMELSHINQGKVQECSVLRQVSVFESEIALLPLAPRALPVKINIHALLVLICDGLWF